MEMRKAEMAKVQEQHQAEREKMKAQKDEMRAAEPSPSPAPADDDLEVLAAEYNDKHSAAWNAKHTKEEQDEEAAPSKHTSSKKLKVKVPKAVVLASEEAMSKAPKKTASKAPV